MRARRVVSSWCLSAGAYRLPASQDLPHLTHGRLQQTCFAVQDFDVCLHDDDAAGVLHKLAGGRRLCVHIAPAFLVRNMLD